MLIGQQLDGSPQLRYSYAVPYNSRNLIGYLKNGSQGGVKQYSEAAMLAWTNEEITTLLTDNFIKDETNINGGYPILKWQVGL